MFVGKYFQSENYFKFANLRCAGAAIGGFGRHTQTTSDGMPILDNRVGVTFKVDAAVIKLSLYV